MIRGKHDHVSEQASGGGDVASEPCASAADRAGDDGDADCRADVSGTSAADEAAGPDTAAGVQGAVQDLRDAGEEPESTQGVGEISDGSGGVASATKTGSDRTGIDRSTESGKTCPGGASPPDGTWMRLLRALRPQFRRGQLLGALLVGTLGFALTVQIQHSQGPENLESLRPEEIRRLLHDQHNERDRLDQQVQMLEDRLDTLRSANQKAVEAQRHVQQQITELRIVQGLVPVHGEGVVITASDPSNNLTTQDLVQVIHELRGAQAEVIEINGVRLLTDSYVTVGNGGLQVDGVQLTSPYTIKAIGHSDTLNKAMLMEGGAQMQLMSKEGVTAEVAAHQEVIIRGVRGVDGSVVQKEAPVSTPVPSAS